MVEYWPPKPGVTGSSPVGRAKRPSMVAVAQVVERLIVGQKVAGSNPVSHPNILSCFASRLTLYSDRFAFRTPSGSSSYASRSEVHFRKAVFLPNHGIVKKERPMSARNSKKKLHSIPFLFSFSKVTGQCR